MPRGKTSNTNIEIETYDQYKSLFNMDSMKDLYRIKANVEVEDGRVQTKEIVFLDFNDQFLDVNRHFLLANSEIKEFQPRWQYKPNYLSYDMYQTLSFSYLLLYINNCISVLDFKFDYVKVPRSSAIKELIISNQRLYPDRTIIKDVVFL